MEEAIPCKIWDILKLKVMYYLFEIQIYLVYFFFSIWKRYLDPRVSLQGLRSINYLPSSPPWECVLALFGKVGDGALGVP